MPLTLERGRTSKDRLKVDWAHPVPPDRAGNETAAAGPIPFAAAIQQMWTADDQRPLLVLRECSKCKDSDEAMFQRALTAEKTVLLTKWFRTVRLPAHVAETGHPFFNVFDGQQFADGWPHFFLMAHPAAKPVWFTATQTPAQLWKGMAEVLEQRYAKNPEKALKEMQSLLDTFDRLDARERDLESQLIDARADSGPDSKRAKQLTADLQDVRAERDAALVKEKQIQDLGLLPMPK
jgi:hypothetical protein